MTTRSVSLVKIRRPVGWVSTLELFAPELFGLIETTSNEEVAGVCANSDVDRTATPIRRRGTRRMSGVLSSKPLLRHGSWLERARIVGLRPGKAIGKIFGAVD